MTARQQGWRLFDGKSLSGEGLSSHLCPRCVGRVRREEPVVVVEGGSQDPLF